MLPLAASLIAVALTAGLFGFGGIAASAVNIAQPLFAVSLVLALASLLAGLMRRP